MNPARISPSSFSHDFVLLEVETAPLNSHLSQLRCRLRGHLAGLTNEV